MKENPKGITDLQQLIANMEPVLNEGEFIFASVADLTTIPRTMTICEMREKEMAAREEKGGNLLSSTGPIKNFFFSLFFAPKFFFLSFPPGTQIFFIILPLRNGERLRGACMICFGYRKIGGLEKCLTTGWLHGLE